MTNDKQLALVMARIELHFARQSEIMEATTARMERSLEQAHALQAGCAQMAQTLDRLEGNPPPPACDM